MTLIAYLLENRYKYFFWGVITNSLHQDYSAIAISAHIHVSFLLNKYSCKPCKISQWSSYQRIKFKLKDIQGWRMTILKRIVKFFFNFFFFYISNKLDSKLKLKASPQSSHFSHWVNYIFHQILLNDTSLKSGQHNTTPLRFV